MGAVYRFRLFQLHSVSSISGLPTSLRTAAECKHERCLLNINDCLSVRFKWCLLHAADVMCVLSHTDLEAETAVSSISQSNIQQWSMKS